MCLQCGNRKDFKIGSRVIVEFDMTGDGIISKTHYDADESDIDHVRNELQADVSRGGTYRTEGEVTCSNCDSDNVTDLASPHWDESKHLHLKNDKTRFRRWCEKVRPKLMVKLVESDIKVLLLDSAIPPLVKTFLMEILKEKEEYYKSWDLGSLYTTKK